MDTRNTKTYFLFQPKHILTKRPVLEIKQWIKTPAGITTGHQPLNKQSIKTFFPAITDDGARALFAFSPAELEKMEGALYQQLSYINTEAERNALVKKTFAKHLQSAFAALRQQKMPELYHHVTGSTANAVQTVKCSLHHYPAELAFKIIQQNGKYRLATYVVTGRDRIEMEACTRFHFLLLHDHTYYQLTAKSHEAAAWLQLQDKLSWDEQELHLLEAATSRLKEWELSVENNITQNAAELITEPEPQVMLSELNNTFLKLEPRFDYDGYMVDGPFEPVTIIQNGHKPVSVIRHREKEQELVELLRSLHEKFSRQHNGFFYLHFDEAQKKGWFLNVYHKLLEMGIGLVGIDMMKHFRFSAHLAKTILGAQQTEGNWISFSITVQFGKEIIPLQHLQKSLLTGQKAVMLKDSSLGVLGEEWLQQYGTLIRHGKIRGTELLVPKWLLMSEETADKESTGAAPVKTGISAAWYSKWQQWEKQNASLYPLPKNLQLKQLRPYQQKGYEWLRLLSEIGGSGCLADDMGLGKTIQTIAFILHKMEEAPQDKFLVVAPASLVYNWQEELKKFATGLNIRIYHGASRDAAAVTDEGGTVVITSYGTLRQDIELLQQVNWNTVVIDESQYIKNPAAQITRAVWQLSSQTRIALSGTPVMNGTEDLFSQLHFLLPGLLGSNEFFRREYAIPIEQKGDAVKAAALQKLIRPFVLRRTKEQAAPDLPSKTESVIWCEMEEEQRAAYESIKENVRSSVFFEIEKSGLNKGKLSVLAGLTKLRQVCNSAELVKDADVFSYESIKTSMLVNELKTIIPQHRALVFSQFTGMLDLLERDLEKEGIRSLRLDGQTAIAKRQELVAAFQEEQTDAPVFLISLKAGNAGLNLTKADYVFLFDPWWNTAVENQAIDRTHRIGQQNCVFAYRMICKNSIEEKIIKMAEKKKKLAEDLVTAEESFVKSLSLDDIKYLLE
ncbi:MAG: DEAD/DEAH box helicase [Ferruginibacter sp.]